MGSQHSQPRLWVVNAENEASPISVAIIIQCEGGHPRHQGASWRGGDGKAQITPPKCERMIVVLIAGYMRRQAADTGSGITEVLGTMGLQRSGQLHHLALRFSLVTPAHVVKVGGVGNGRQDADNDDHYHYLDQRKAPTVLLAHRLCHCLHIPILHHPRLLP